MHRSVIEFAHRTLNTDTVAGKTVLEVGSQIINGSVRPHVVLLEPSCYIGVDMEEGTGVDVVVDCKKLTSHFDQTFDLVITTEMMEHVDDWRACMWELAQVVSPQGLLVLTTRSPGFPYHPFPEDNWRYSLEDMERILAALDLETVILETDPEAPGVFVVARKPSNWKPRLTDLDDIVLIQPVPDKKPETQFPGAIPAEGHRLALAFPLVQTVPVTWLFQFLQMDKSPLVGTVATRGVYLVEAMERLVKQALAITPAFDRVVVYEHDMIPPLDALTRIAQYGDDIDIAGSVYFRHEWPHHVMAWMQTAPPYYSPLTAELLKTMVEKPALYPVDGVAMGFTSIHRRVFEQWDKTIPMFKPTPPLVGHDLHFCNEAKRQGFSVHLDSGIVCGHLTEVAIGYEDSQAALAEDKPPTWAVLDDGTLPMFDLIGLNLQDTP